MSTLTHVSGQGKTVDRSASRLRLRTIVRLRWMALVGQLVAILVVYFGLGYDLPFWTCIAAIAISAIVNIVLLLRYPASLVLSSKFAIALLGYDLFQLTFLLYLTGGVQNPFSFLLLVPVTISAATQPRGFTIVLGILAVLCVSFLMYFHFPLPWGDAGGLAFPAVYRVGLWSSIVCGIVFTSFYTWRIAREARQMSAALAATELVLAREQKLSALDGLAAAAAHELGTPLSTITVITKELERDLPEDSVLAEDIALLRSQAGRCRDILATLTERDGQSDSMFARMPISHLLEEVIEPHRGMGVSIDVSAGPRSGLVGVERSEPVFARNPGILYGLGNLVENAADFAAQQVVVSAVWDSNEIIVKITDDGPGFPIPVLENLGRPYVTTRPAEPVVGDDGDHVGMGLGFFIAKTLLERSSAALLCSNRERPERGAIVQIVWQRAVVDENFAGAEKAAS